MRIALGHTGEIQRYQQGLSLVVKELKIGPCLGRGIAYGPELFGYIGSNEVFRKLAKFA
jgi:hypothetical protein